MDRIKNIIIGFFSFIWVSEICVLAVGEIKEGGSGINGFLSFILWAVCVFLIIRGRAGIAAIASTVIVIVMAIPKLNTAGLSDAFWEMYDIVVQAIALIVIIKFVINKLT